MVPWYIHFLFLFNFECKTHFDFHSNVIKGQAGEVASTIQFKPGFEDGALLTVVRKYLCNITIKIYPLFNSFDCSAGPLQEFNM
jgi:hypothetical protein